MESVESDSSIYKQPRSLDRQNTIRHNVESRFAGENHLAFMARQVFVVDPRGQGLGLRDYAFLDAYANKFFILSGRQGVFISPKTIPNELLAYYDQLGIDTPLPENVISAEAETDDASLVDRISSNPAIGSMLAKRRGSFIIPYMVTAEIEKLANMHGLNTLVDSDTVSHMADKADFQEELAAIAADVAKDTGYDVAIPMGKTKAGNRFSAERLYSVLSRKGTKDVVVIKPKSASGLGIFILRAGKGIDGLSEVLAEHFSEDDEVLIEEFIDHNHSPSMQGARKPDTDYGHIYFGRQIISSHGDRIEYDSSQIPFGPETVKIETYDLNKMQEVHKAVGERLIQGKGITGVAGFDTVTQISSDGKVDNLKITELNLHLPSSLAVYAAIDKVFPDGFTGIAHNMNATLKPNQTVHAFIKQHNALLVSKKHEYGMFPLNLSYEDKADIVLFAEDSEHLKQLLGGIQI